MPEIKLPEQIELSLVQQIDAIEKLKAKQHEYLQIVFAMAEHEMPKDGRYQIKEGKLIWDEPK